MAATIALKRLIEAISVKASERKIFVCLTMSEGGQESIQIASVEIDPDKKAIYLPAMQLSAEGFTAYKTLVLHQGEDGEDFLIASFSLLEGELNEHGMGVFTATTRYYSLRDIQSLTVTENLDREVEIIADGIGI